MDIRVYTASFRLVKVLRKEQYLAAGRNHVSVSARELDGISAGTYYCNAVFYEASRTEKTRPAVLIMLGR